MSGGTLPDSPARGLPRTIAMRLPNAREWPRELAAAAVLLLRASELAESLERSSWDFAVELAELRRIGLSNADLRWLICLGFVDHAAELAPAASHERIFTTTGTLTFHRRTCFVLTDLGRSAARHLTCTSVSLTATNPSLTVPTSGGGKAQDFAGGNQPRSSDDQAAGADASSPGTARAGGETGASIGPLEPVKPVWDADLNRLSLGDCVVKEYRTPAPNQQLVLSAFQEEGWPPRIDDPLPPVADLDPKRRLHETIISLNRHQRNRVLRFSGDGHALGIRWEVMCTDGQRK